MSIDIQQLQKKHLFPLWEPLHGLVPEQPEPQATPYQWHYAEVKDALLDIGSKIDIERAERRVLVMENPSLPPGSSRITDTLYAGMQMVLPGEIAPLHRHTPTALRFILEAEGGNTTVDGEQTTLHPGDFIITPSWRWHQHQNDTDKPIFWLDGLDAPLLHFLKAGFRQDRLPAGQTLDPRPEGDALARYGAGLMPLEYRPTGQSQPSPIFNYPYQRTREALEQLQRHSEIDPANAISLRYINPANGDWAIPTLGTVITLLPKGFTSLYQRGNASQVLVVMEGELEIRLTGGIHFRLKPKDIFALPSWLSYRLSAPDGDTVCFSFSDRPVLEKLGIWRHEIMPEG
ncbi:cupin domain-containing protein [Serratia proteamaculans]|uniref:cupin domain-containing protein n=1 Tax=Serratia proteamaculans TaxID=28151 RepID=UPI0039BDCC08